MIDENKVTWAVSTYVDSLTGDPNKAPIDSEVRLEGLGYRVPLTLQLFNQLMYDYGQAIIDLQNQLTPKVDDVWQTYSSELPEDRFGVGTWTLISSTPYNTWRRVS